MAEYACPICGKERLWLARLAGQRVRCACGAMMIVPADENGVVVVAGAAVPKPASGGGSAAIGTGTNLAHAHLLWPGIFAAAGLVLTAVYYGVAMPLSFPAAMLAMSIRLTIDLVLLFAGCLLAMKLLDMALGEPVEAIVKLLGVALLPAAAESLIGTFVPGGFLLGWAVSLGLYGALLMWFFDLNGKEVMTLTTVVWLVQSWGAIVISALLLPNVLGSKVPLNGPIAWAIGSVAVDDKKPPETEDGAAQRLLKSAGTAEANAWTMIGPHTLGGRDRAQSQRYVNLLYKAGAQAVYVAQIKAGGDSGMSIASTLVVRLPERAEERAKVITVATSPVSGGATASASASVLVPADQQYLLVHLAATQAGAITD